MSPAISVIVPFYNVEDYIINCLDSLINQTLKNIEIILVNDCSTDSSLSKIQELIDFHKNIKLINHTENKGLSAARNTGINNAKGDFIAFVDSDDFVELTMYEKMYEASQYNKVDIVSCGYNKVNTENKILFSSKFPIESNCIYDKSDISGFITNSHKNTFIWFVWRNIYKRELLIDKNLFFYEDLRFGEDSIFNLYAFSSAKRMIVLDDCLYNYRDTPNSLTSKKGKTYLEDNLSRQYEKKMEFYVESKINKEFLYDLHTYVGVYQLPMILTNLIYLEEDNLNKEIKRVLNKRMIQESLSNIPLISKNIPRGIQPIFLLSKFKQTKLLGLYLKKIAKT